MSEKRKIIEIYVTEDEIGDGACFEVEKCEDTDIADFVIKGLLMMFNFLKNDEDELKVQFENEE